MEVSVSLDKRGYLPGEVVKILVKVRPLDGSSRPNIDVYHHHIPILIRTSRSNAFHRRSARRQRQARPTPTAAACSSQSSALAPKRSILDGWRPSTSRRCPPPRTQRCVAGPRVQTVQIRPAQRLRGCVPQPLLCCFLLLS